MRIVIFTQSIWSIPSIQQLALNKQISGIVLPQKDFQNQEMLMEVAINFGLEIFRWDGQDQVEIGAWIATLNVDRGVSFGFSYKIPKAIFESFEWGVLNVHYGKLPKYAGAAPLFWTLKNGEKSAVISFHKIDENWDAGILVSESIVPIFPGEPYGFLASRLSVLAGKELLKALDKLPLSEGELLTPNEYPFPRPKEEDLTIDWKTQSADEVEFLVNAANPNYGGAITTFRGSQIRILEVSPAEVNIEGVFSAGTIVYADATYGVFVLCADYKYLRINIFQMDGTIITGPKLAALGVRSYEQMI
ncbi:methionyl-tRNA formyltransferase [Algoriphagus aquimarinus]|uniref:Methionyl-tRNA formyltransferase n=1 Tax=Algoriphagus aquimarinus TaxID=237018 RepID=A0A1I1B8K2_9BACT|nr:formyltransferase family protein [Algoriphagus aquimarinus]SFB46102.1 methionyl-tRNA formyltransferase [Algoriphagus aquimarinus]